MGLDRIELVMAVEDEFKIDIPDHVAEQMTTVGAIHEYVVERLREFPTGTCQSATMFYYLRSSLATAFGTERSRVQLDAPMATLFGGKKEHWAWSALENQLGFRLPRLVYPRWRRVSMDIWGLLCLAAVAHTWITSELAIVPCILPPFAVAVVLWSWITDRFGRIPVSCATVRGTVEMIASSLPVTGENVDPAAVWDGVRRIVSEQLGIAQEEIVPESRFLEDLGCD